MVNGPLCNVQIYLACVGDNKLSEQLILDEAVLSVRPCLNGDTVSAFFDEKFSCRKPKLRLVREGGSVEFFDPRSWGAPL